jgi:V8-like Glu-specific endopeptidase
MHISNLPLNNICYYHTHTGRSFPGTIDLIDGMIIFKTKHCVYTLIADKSKVISVFPATHNHSLDANRFSSHPSILK